MRDEHAAQHVRSFIEPTRPTQPDPISAALRAITAKTDQSGQTTDTMSLIQHGRDSAAVMGWLWDNWLPTHVTQQFAEHFNSGALARTYACWIASAHDAGKASLAFQLNLSRNGDLYGVRHRLERNGFEFPPGSSERHVPHCRIGQGVVDRWLEHRELNDGRATTSVSALVGAHHGVAAQLEDVTALRQDRYATVVELEPRDQAWIAAQNAFLDLMTTELAAAAAIRAALTKRLSPSLQVTLGGLIVVADWLASDAGRFPYAEDPDMAQRLREANLGADILPPWRPSQPDASENLLTTRFGFPDLVTPNSGQQALIDAARGVEKPALFVFEAPTGSGKTEAALMAAEILAAKFECGGLEFLLPTRGTTDGVWERLTPWIENLPGQGRQSVSLAHGKATLNDNFMRLSRQSRYVSIGADGADPELPGDSCDAATQAFVSSWFAGRRKATLATMVAGTVDQLLLSALQTRHVALRHVGLVGKVVIIDECHAVDEYMLTYLERALQWLGAHHVPVIAMSATLPDETRARLVKAYAGHPNLSPTTPSPLRLTTATPDAVETITPEFTGQDRVVDLSFVGDDPESIVTAAVAAVEEDACVAIIRNTVKEAQATYQVLRERLGAERVELLHSRFVGVHRSAKEQQLRRRLGPDADDRPAGYVIVATQVLEVSLDIDVDLMISDIAPLDTLFQRAGRLHRHRRGEGEQQRPVPYRRARLLISGCEAPSPGHAPAISAGSRAVYGEYRLLRALATIMENDGKRVSLHDVPRLVQDAYADANCPGPSSWHETVITAEGKHFTAVADQNGRASVFAVPPPDRNFRSLSNLMPHRASEAETESHAAAQVRDSEESVEVIAVRYVGGEAYPLPGVGLPTDVPVPTQLDAPEPQQARVLAKCTVTLPPRLTRFSLDATLDALERASSRFTGWQLSPLLRGELVLPLDENDEFAINGVTVRYDCDLGLIEVVDDQEDQ